MDKIMVQGYNTYCAEGDGWVRAGVKQGELLYATPEWINEKLELRQPIAGDVKHVKVSDVKDRRYRIPLPVK